MGRWLGLEGRYDPPKYSQRNCIPEKFPSRRIDRFPPKSTHWTRPRGPPNRMTIKGHSIRPPTFDSLNSFSSLSV